ncbi:hypothetical protein HMPREF0083_02587 [Aneurinibacillus aneurinilyticus ATCC 12856]|uniref:Uncharacterized protein n=1 Tax=Aneurinibacillus aneurinilyticus ATCC 12856 TaxID=649747 RepID=U1X456_ANEAE|nr:hypothetical protein HMPREF0083_02587 [Aneurinibacillus aneurinilyticus ATCC 12856]
MFAIKLPLFLFNRKMGLVLCSNKNINVDRNKSEGPGVFYCLAPVILFAS